MRCLVVYLLGQPNMVINIEEDPLQIANCCNLQILKQRITLLFVLMDINDQTCHYNEHATSK